MSVCVREGGQILHWVCACVKVGKFFIGIVTRQNAVALPGPSPLRSWYEIVPVNEPERSRKK